METREILEKLQRKEITIEEAHAFLKQQPYEEMGFAKIDHHRKIRSGLSEVIYCEGKSNQHLISIFQKLYETNQEVLGTRASKEQYELVKKKIPDICYDEISRILKIEKEDKKRIGKIVVCSAGTADIPVAEEAAQVAEFFGGNVERIYDIGVCGIHRLLAQLDRIQSANCIIAAAGMEGALASVLAGLVDVPVIALPTSVGYGVSKDGIAAMIAMVASCANGISVVNIDNGFGAAYNATLINRLAERTRGNE